MPKLRVLFYHRIGKFTEDVSMLGVTSENFENHIKHLSENFDILRFNDDFEKWSNRAKRDGVIITFDDGYRDLYTNAFPILSKYNVPATIFISTGYIDGVYEPWMENIHRVMLSPNIYHDELIIKNDVFDICLKTDSYKARFEAYLCLRRIFQISDSKTQTILTKMINDWAGFDGTRRENRRFLSADEIKNLSDSGLIDIGVHTVTHASLGNISRECQYEEIAESKKTLENIIGRDIDIFSYPFGTKADYTKDTIDILRQCGLKKAAVAYPGDWRECSEYEIPRSVVKNFDIDDFIKYINMSVFNNEIKENDLKNQTDNDCVVKYMGKLSGSDFISNINDVVIWGTGDNAKYLMDYIVSNGYKDKVFAFADNYKRMDEFYGIKVISADEAIECGRPVIVKSVWDTAIVHQLLETRVNDIYWITE